MLYKNFAMTCSTFFVAIIIMCLTACTEEHGQFLIRLLQDIFGSSIVLADANDKTPPALYVSFRYSGGRLTIDQNDKFDGILNRDESILLMAVAEDPEGIKTLTIYHDYVYICGNERRQPLIAPQTITIDARPGDTVPTRLVLPHQIVGRVPPCSNGVETFQIIISAENFSGLTSQMSNISFAFRARQ